MADRDELVENMETVIQMVCGTSDLEQRLDEVRTEIPLLIQMTQELVSQNARQPQDQVDYQSRYDSMMERYEALRVEEGELKAGIEEHQLKREVIKAYTGRLAEQKETLTEFDTDLWTGLVDFITVYAKDDVRVTFKDGTEIKA